jgi:HEAT repeat protein
MPRSQWTEVIIMRKMTWLCTVLVLLVPAAVSAENKNNVQDLIKQLKDKDESVRLKAAKDLGKLGPKAKDAIAALKAATNDSDPDVRAVAERSLQMIQASGPGKADTKVATLAKALSNKDRKLRLQALEELAQLGEEGKDSSPDVVALILDRSPLIREKAAETLEKINPSLHRPLVTLLVDMDHTKRVQALESIAQMGSDGEPALPVLIILYQQQLASRRPSIRQLRSSKKAPQRYFAVDAPTILHAMVSVAPREKVVTRAVLNAISAGDSTLRAMAIELSAGLELDNESLVQSLVRALEDQAWRVEAVNALEKLGPDAKQAVPTLKKLRFDPSNAVREAVAKALDRIEEK